MSTHSIRFYGELTKIILKLSSDTLLIYSGVGEAPCHGLMTFFLILFLQITLQCLDRVKRIWYLSPMRAAKVQASLRIRAVSPEPPLLAHISSESRRTFRQKTRSLAPLNGWTCPVEICHDGMLEDTNSLDGALSGFICLFIWFEILYIVSGPTVLPIVA